MAYGNWGAFVFLNGERRTDKEDVGVFDTDEAKFPTCYRIFANIMKNKENNDDSPHRRSHHAVLGDGSVRLCAYKHSPVIYIASDDGAVSEVDIEPFQIQDDRGVWDDHEYEGTINGHEFKITQYNNNMVDIWMKTPDGDIWTSTSGYEYGAGFMDDMP